LLLISLEEMQAEMLSTTNRLATAIEFTGNAGTISK
jgi:hypothetical protein